MLAAEELQAESEAVTERKEKVESWQLTEIVSIGRAVELTIW